MNVLMQIVSITNNCLIGFTYRQYFSADPKEYDDTTSCSADATMCKFPFKVNEKTYTSCTDDIVVEDDDVIIIDKDGNKKQTFQWCATSVNENQFMKKDKWGICDISDSA